MIGGDALEAADGDRLAVHARPAAGRFARTIAGAAQDAGKNVGFAVEEIGVREPAVRNQPNVLRDIRMRRTRPLTIHNAVVVRGVPDVRRIHAVPVIIGHGAEMRGSARRAHHILRACVVCVWRSG